VPLSNLEELLRLPGDSGINFIAHGEDLGSQYGLQSY